MYIKFEWDIKKAASNLKKHRVSFEIAARVFADPFAMVVQDHIENGELRWQTLAMVEGFLILLIAHAVKNDDAGMETVCIISARRADAKERKRCEENRWF